MFKLRVSKGLAIDSMHATWDPEVQDFHERQAVRCGCRRSLIRALSLSLACVAHSFALMFEPVGIYQLALRCMARGQWMPR